MCSSDLIRNKSIVIKFSNNNKNFIKEACILLYMLGIANSEFIGRTENAYNGKKSGTYTSAVIITDNLGFKNKVGFVLNRKNKRLLNATTSTFNRLGFHLTRVTDIKEISYNDYVYDIEVTDTHKFFANNILVHNTDSIYFKSKKNTLKEMEEEGFRLLKKVNDSYNLFVSQYGVDKNDCSIEMEFEKIFKKILFVGKRDDPDLGAKKKYAFILLWKDGEKIPEHVEYKGFATVRSDIPKISRNTQRKVIHMILHDKSKEEVMDYIRGIEHDIRSGKINIEDVAFPGAIKNDISLYGITKQDENGKSRKTGTPPVIQGARYSNKYLNTKFTKGMKPKWIYVKSVPPGYPETKYVTFSTDLPDGFSPDYNEMSRKIFKMKLSAIFQAIGWKEFPILNTDIKSLSNWR